MNLLPFFAYVWLATRAPYVRTEPYSLLPHFGLGALAVMATVAPEHPSAEGYLVAAVAGVFLASAIDWLIQNDLD